MMEEINNQIEEVLKAFPLLKRKAEKIVEGTVVLNHSYNDVFRNGKYNIEISIPENYPAELPIVREIGEQIDLKYPHIYKDRTLCLATEGDMKVSLYPDYKLVDFIKKYVISYFYTYSYFEEYGIYPFNDRSHGFEGIIEFYMEYFNLENKNQVINILKLISSKVYKGHYTCYCGSEKKIRDCHKNKVLEIRNSGLVDVFKEEYRVIEEERKRNG